jgi:hypothetical protein
MSGVTPLFPLYAFMAQTRTSSPVALYKIVAGRIQLPKLFLMVKLENIKKYVD